MGAVVSLPLGFVEGAGLRLVPGAVNTPALISQIQPGLVLTERDARSLSAAVSAADVHRGGRFTIGPSGAALWSGPFDGADGGPGNAVVFGAVDWAHDTPIRHYVTLLRAIVTAAGTGAGESPASILDTLLALTGLTIDPARVTTPHAPPRDPFRRPSA